MGIKDWFISQGGWVNVLLFGIIMFLAYQTMPDTGAGIRPPAKFVRGQEVRLKVTGGKGVIVRLAEGGYIVRYAEQDGRLCTMPMDEAELVDWPSSYQVPKPEPK